MSTSTEPSNLSQCQECDGTARLVTIVHGRNDKPAWIVFKCEECGFYNWETQPRRGCRDVPHA